MSAAIDKSAGAPYFILDGNLSTGGALADGSPWLWQPGRDEAQAFSTKSLGFYGRKSWRVCTHLDSPGKFIHHYLEYRLFLLADGEVFCHNCHPQPHFSRTTGVDNQKKNFSLSDEQLQRYVFDPLYVVNGELGGRTAAASLPVLSWYVCSHLAGEAKVAAHLKAGGVILFAENNVTCPACLNTALNGGFNVYEENLVLMTDGDFQQQVVDTIITVNRQAGTHKDLCAPAPWK